MRWLPFACVLGSGLLGGCVIGGCVIERTNLPTEDTGGDPTDAGLDAAARDAPDVGIPRDVPLTPPDVITPPPDARPDAFTCNEGELRCNGDALEYCNMETWTHRADCAVGCLPDGMPRCRPFIPSTVPMSEMNGTADVDLVGTGASPTRAFVIDTTTCNGAPPAGLGERIPAGDVHAVGDYCVLAVRSLRVRSNAALVGNGSRPLIVLATETISVEDTSGINVSAYTFIEGESGATRAGRYAFAGAGASTSGVGGPGMGGASGGDGGGGGGGYCTGGAAGGLGATTGEGGLAGGAWGVGGMAEGAINLRQLRAGSRGGDGSPGTASSGGRGGGGGGAVQLSAGRSITITGSVAALGGAGEGGSVRTTSAGAAGGGGSGGMILIEAPTLSVRDDSLLVGGGGGGGASCGIDNLGVVTGVDGAHGGNGGAMASGGSGGSGGVCTSVGGDGGAASSATGPSIAGSPSTHGGGGGAGAGCVSIRTRSGAAFPTAASPRMPEVTATGNVIGT